MKRFVAAASKLIAIVGAAITLVACETTPTVQSGSSAQTSFDGLVKVDNTVMDEAWVRPGLDLSSYSKLWMVSAGVQYRPAAVVKRGSALGRNQNVFGLTQEQKDRFEKVVNEQFREELKNVQSFELVNEPGPDTLVLVGGLLDVVSYVPPETMGRSEIFLSEIGEATLVLELKDSQTAAVLVRAVDRRAASRAGGGMTNVNRVTTWSEVRRLTNSWARLLARRIDELKSADLTAAP